MSTSLKRFSLGILLVFSSYSLVITQAVPFLTQVGYSSYQMGLVLSFVGVISIFGQIFLGYLSDRFGTIKKFFLFLSVMMVGLVFMSFMVQSNHFLYHFLVLGTASGLTRVLVNLYETWVMEIDSLRDHFGFVRGFGSVGWALAALGSGYLIRVFSYQGLAYACAFLTLIFVFISIQMSDAEKTVGLDLKFSEIKLLFKNKNYVAYLVVYFIAYFVYNADSVTVTDLMIVLGGGPEEIGVKWFVQAMCELPLLLLGARVLLRYKAKPVMVFASVMMLARMMLVSFAPNIPSVILISMLQAFTYPFILMSQKQLVYNELPPHLRSTGQMVAVSLTAGLAAVLMPLTSGIMIAFIDIRVFLRLASLLMLIPIYVMGSKLT